LKSFIKIFLGFFIAIWIVVNVFTALDMSFLGFRIYRVATGSMEPNLRINDVVIIKKQDNYTINDIVTYKKNGNYITHRIVQENKDVITTKGDNNNSEDESILKEDIVGKVIYTFKLIGFVLFMLSEPSSWIVIFVVCIILIFSIPVKLEKGGKNEGKTPKKKS